MMTDEGCDPKESVVNTISGTKAGLGSRNKVKNMATTDKDSFKDFAECGSQLNWTVRRDGIWSFERFQEDKDF